MRSCILKQAAQLALVLAMDAQNLFLLGVSREGGLHDSTGLMPSGNPVAAVKERAYLRKVSDWARVSIKLVWLFMAVSNAVRFYRLGDRSNIG
jgi:hypothetical protein